MTLDERETTVVEDVGRPGAEHPVRGPAHAHQSSGDDRVVASRRVATARPTGWTVAARLVALVFGIIQLIIGLRIVFLLLNAREGNALVAGVLDLSRPLVAPFEGIFQTNALQAGGSILDISAVAALVGWTILEFVVLGFMRIPRPGEDV